MEIKSQKNLVESITQAHSVVVNADDGDPIFVAVHIGDSIMCAIIGDTNFEKTLQYAGINRAPKVLNLPDQK